MHRRSAPLLLAVLAVQALAQSDRIAVLEGIGGGRHAIRVFDESEPRREGSLFLTDVTVAPIEITNRVATDDFVPSIPRVVAVAGVPCIALPGGGRVLRYARGGGAQWGYLLIGADGAPVVLREAAGVGATGLDDPWEDRIGVGLDGRHAALATRAGEFWLARLDGADWSSTGAPTRPIALPPGTTVATLTPTIGAGVLFYMTSDDRVWRCGLADGATPQDVSPSPAGLRLKDEFALSGDGTTAVFLYGPRDFYTIWRLGVQGPATALSPPPSQYEEPGYLPEQVGGPRMKLNGDGSRLMYVDGVVRDEVFVLDLPSGAATQVTSDANFLPYIGTLILPMFVAAGDLVLGVGDPARFDWFAASPTSAVVRNLTNTGANAIAPFDAGQLVPVAAYGAGAGTVFSIESVAGAMRARRIDVGSGASSIVRTNLSRVPQLGETLGARASVLMRDAGGDALFDLASGAAVLVAPPGIELTREAVAPGGFFGVFAARGAADPSGVALPILHIPAFGLVALPPTLRLSQLVVTRSGNLLQNGSDLRFIGGGQSLKVRSLASERVVLSGASS